MSTIGNSEEIEEVLERMKDKEAVLNNLNIFGESMSSNDVGQDRGLNSSNAEGESQWALLDVVRLSECLLTMMVGHDNHNDDVIGKRTKSNRSNRGSRANTQKTDLLGKHVIVTLGRSGVLWCWFNGTHPAKWMHFPAISLGGVSTGVNTNGAGDAFCAGVVHRMLTQCQERKQREVETGSGSVTGLTLTEDCIQSGLLQAHTKILQSIR